MARISGSAHFPDAKESIPSVRGTIEPAEKTALLLLGKSEGIPCFKIIGTFHFEKVGPWRQENNFEWRIPILNRFDSRSFRVLT
jgi:hypothetical protein